MKAVILAGGKGERLQPLTNAIPKALAPIDGVPIIKQQIDTLITLGITEILVLTGYRSDMISRYLKFTFAKSRANILCKVTPVEFSPAERLIDAAAELSETFLLLYCDNLVGDFQSISQVIDSAAPVTFLVEKRIEGNMVITPKITYMLDRSRESPYVELGYIKIFSGIFFHTLCRLGSLPMTLKSLSLENECSAIITEHPLKSISNMSRFNILRSNRKTILLDRDGILNRKMPLRKYLSNFKDYAPIEKNLSDIKKFLSSSTDFIVITNQPGIGTGEVSPNFLDSLHSKIIVDLLANGISVVGIYVCPHHWDDDCECRKPKPGMINQAIKDYELEQRNLVYIGDEEKDIQAARNAGILGIRISENEGPNAYPSIPAAYDEIYKRIIKNQEEF